MSTIFRKTLICLVAVFAVAAIASASASAGPTCVPNLGGPFKCEFEVQKCEAVAGGIFTNGTCEVVGAGGFGEAGALEKLAAGKKRLVTSKIKPGTEFVLKASGIEVKCKSATDTGTITGGAPGTDEATTIMFDECTTSIPGCLVKTATKTAGNILVSNIKTKLVEGEKTSGGPKVVADEFAGKGEEEEFVTLEFGKKEKGGKLEEKCSATIPLTAKVVGKVFAISQEEGLPLVGLLKFPTGGLFKPKTTLKVFGLAAELTGEEEETGVGGGKVKEV